MLTDQGSIFLSKEWRFNYDRVDISLQNTGAESHNSLGRGEKYHSTLRTIYNNVAHEHPDLARDVALDLSVQAMTCTVGPHGLVPSLLVFDVLPKLPLGSVKSFPAQQERLRAASTAREEYERYVSKALVVRGLRSRPPPASNHAYKPGDFVYAYRERLRHYTSPHLISSVDGKCVRIHTGECTGP